MDKVDELPETMDALECLCAAMNTSTDEFHTDGKNVDQCIADIVSDATNLLNESPRSPACSTSDHERKCISELDYAITVLDCGDSKLSQSELIKRCRDLLNGEIESIFGS